MAEKVAAEMLLRASDFDSWVRDKKSVALSNGLTVKYKEFGDATKPALLLLHGYSDTSRSWSLSRQYLETDFHLFALDQRGHGGTDAPDMTYTYLDMATDVTLFMDALGIPKAHIAGHSMGSMIAQVVAAHFPDRVGSIVLVGSADSSAEVCAPGGELAAGIRDLSEPPDPKCAFMDAWYENPKPVNPLFIVCARAEACAMPRSVWWKVLDMLAQPYRTADTPPVRCPVLITWGTKDALFDRASQGRLRAVYPGQPFAMFVGCGHNLLWEEPEQLATEMKDFLRT